MTARRNCYLLFLLIALYGVIITPFTSYLKNKPFAEKMGAVPKAQVLKYVSADQKQLVAAAIVTKVLYYFGSVVEKSPNKVQLPADYSAMSRAIHAAVGVDPYNMDGYYFAQAILVWDVGKIDIANELLEYGMRYRTWDWYLPFFAGFNYGYFLKDYAAAAKYYQRAGELSGAELHQSLAGKYLLESGQTAHAAAYLSMMAKSSKNAAMRQVFERRLKVVQRMLRVEGAFVKFRAANGRLPKNLDEIVSQGFLPSVPEDIYIDKTGVVRTTTTDLGITRKGP